MVMQKHNHELEEIVREQIQGEHEHMASKKETPMEKHIQTVLLSIITFSLITAGTVLFSVNNQVAVMQYQLKALTDSAGQFVTKDVLDARGRVQDLQLNQFEQRLQALEKKSGK